MPPDQGGTGRVARTGRVLDARRCFGNLGYAVPRRSPQGGRPGRGPARALLLLLLPLLACRKEGPAVAPIGPVFVPVDSAVSRARLPRAPIVLTVSSRRWAELTRDLPSDTAPVPLDCALLLAFPLPQLRSVGDRTGLTPPDGDVGLTMPCRSDDPNIACVPHYEWSPPRGMVLVRCHCLRVGTEDEEDGGIDVPQLRLPSCRIAVGRRLTCEGKCVAPGQRCLAGRLMDSTGVWGVTCRCRPGRGT
jgi:hypothetical protein